MVPCKGGPSQCRPKISSTWVRVRGRRKACASSLPSKRSSVSSTSAITRRAAGSPARRAGARAGSCPGIAELDRWGPQKGLGGTYRAVDGSGIGRRQLGNDEVWDAICDSHERIHTLSSAICAFLSGSSIHGVVNCERKPPLAAAQSGSSRASLIRLCANTAECTYAWNPARPDHRQRSNPKQRFRYEMLASMPARKRFSSP